MGHDSSVVCYCRFPNLPPIEILSLRYVQLYIGPPNIDLVEPNNVVLFEINGSTNKPELVEFSEL